MVYWSHTLNPKGRANGWTKYFEGNMSYELANENSVQYSMTDSLYLPRPWFHYQGLDQVLSEQKNKWPYWLESSN